ncbi:MAG: hypothetical protein L0099_02345 [Acidobacteria bacterium]|nr:hypothetical protein [Acidobacteriota bacterium]
MTLGIVERDLTGDGVPEVLSLTAIGETVDSLDVTFLIQSSGRTLYKTTWPMTRTVGFDAGRRRLSDAELHAHLQEFGGWFFEESKFMSPTSFLSWLQASARLHVPRIPEVIARGMTPSNLPRARTIWDETQAGGITVFKYSPGGDAIKVIGWSATDGRFYDLLECC